MDENKNMLTEEELFDVLSFAREIYGMGNIYNAITPNMLNANLNSLNNDPRKPHSTADVDKALESYVDNASLLQSYTEFAEAYDMLFKRNINYYANLLSFDLTYTPMGISDPSEYQSQEYKDDRRRVEKFLESFDYDSEFRKVLKHVLRNEIDFTWLRTNQGKTYDLDVDDDKTTKLSRYTLQVMPQKYCLLTGYSEWGLLYDIDMNYFLKAGVDIRQFDPIFRRYFKETFGDNVNNEYNPVAQFKDRNGTFAMWHQTSPEAGAWAFKLQPDNFNATPYLAPMIKDVLDIEEVKGLEADANMIAAYGILAGEIPLMDKQKSGQTQDATAFKNKTFMQFMKLVAAGLNNKIKAVAMPAENIHFYQYENKNPNLVEDSYTSSANVGASAGRIIYSSDKVSQAELQAQITNDYNFVSNMYSQFEAFLNYYVNKKLRKYRYKFSFNGSTYSFINEPRHKALMDLANVGLVLDPVNYACLINMKPHEFESALKAGRYSGISELLTPLMSLHNQTSDSGRPKSSDNDITDGGSIAREYD